MVNSVRSSIYYSLFTIYYFFDWRELRTYALVTIFHPHAARRPRRRGSHLAQAFATRRACPAIGRRHLFPAASGTARLAQDSTNPARRDDPHRRAGIILTCLQPPRS